MDDIKQTKTNLEQLGSVVQRISADDDFEKKVDDTSKKLKNTINHLVDILFDIEDINSKINILETELREQRRKTDKYSSMFGNYKILLLEVENRNKTIGIKYDTSPIHNRAIFEIWNRGGDKSGIGFTFSYSVIQLSNFKEYFNNFYFDVQNF